MRPVDRLRAATSAIHRRLEELPHSRAVLAGTIPLHRFARFLRGLLPIVEEVERSAAALVDVAKAPLLERDLEALRLDRYAVDRAVLHGAVLAQRLRFEPPGFALGALYVIEGSTLGGLVQLKALGAVLPAAARSYLSVYGAQTRRHFEAFVERLDAALAGEAAVEAACRGAVATFEAIEAIASALEFEGDAGRFGSVLNSSGGEHTVAADVREVRAALDAGEHTWRRFEYFEARYGERGRRFTRSDSAWLAGLGTETASPQIHWLGRVLAARGMPRWLLEEHLLALHDRLCAAVPKQRLRYQALRKAAEELRAQRLGAVPDGAFDRCEAALPPLRAGALIAAAIADERCGVPRAEETLRPWMEERFGAAAVAGVLAHL